MSDNIKDSMNHEDQPDFTIEKLLFYKEFLKFLYVMSKIHDACMRSQELLGVCL